MPKEAAQRKRRTPEQQIADLESKIHEIKTRAERQKVKKDPALRHVSAALRAVDKALGETSDSATRQALGEARATLSACLSLNGGAVKAGRSGTIPAARRGGRVEPERVLDYLEKHPGSRSEELSAALGAETTALRSALQQLRSDGRARSEGQGRGTRYYAGAGR